MTNPSEDHFEILANETAKAPFSVSTPPTRAEFRRQEGLLAVIFIYPTHQKKFRISAMNTDSY